VQKHKLSLRTGVDVMTGLVQIVPNFSLQNENMLWWLSRIFTYAPSVNTFVLVRKLVRHDMDTIRKLSFYLHYYCYEPWWVLIFGIQSVSENGWCIISITYPFDWSMNDGFEVWWSWTWCNPGKMQQLDALLQLDIFLVDGLVHFACNQLSLMSC